MAPKRPRRQRKGDRLLNPDAREAEIKCDYALAPMDRLANQMDVKWGIDRLPELVSPALAQKYGAAMAHLNDVLRDSDPDKTLAASENCIRGLQAMDAEAEANGAPKAGTHLFEFELEAGEGEEPFRFAVMEDDAQWRAAKDARPDLVLFSKREVALALRAYVTSPLVTETKKHFTKAEIISTKPPCDYANGGDPLEF